MKEFNYNEYLKNNPLLKENEEPIEEDLSLIGDIALGVVGGLAGLWAAVGITKFVKNMAMAGLGAIADKAESAAKNAARNRRKETVTAIIQKFKGDTQLESMYAALPQSSDKTKNERNKQLKMIAEYIKSKLTPEEMKYFTDVSSMLRTGDIAEDFNPLRKMKDFAGEKGWAFSARRPTDEEDAIGREYMESQGKKLGSIGVDRITGNINVMEPNGDFRAILSPDGEELSAYEMDIHEAEKEEKPTTSSNPNTAKIEKFMNDNKTFIDKIKLFVGSNPKLLAAFISSLNQKISTDKKIRQTSDAQQAGKFLKKASGEKPIQASKEDVNESKKRKK